MKKLRRFLKEVKEELDQVSWPDKDEVVASTGVVIVFVLVLSLFLGGVDFLLMKLIQFIMK